MGPLKAIETVFHRALQFNGRSARSEYWWFFAVSLVATYAAVAIDVRVLGLYQLGQKTTLLSLSTFVWSATLILLMSVGMRRLQDTGLLGWIYIGLTTLQVSVLFSSVPWVSAMSQLAVIVTAVLCIRGSQPGSNPFGPNPYEVPT